MLKGIWQERGACGATASPESNTTVKRLQQHLHSRCMRVGAYSVTLRTFTVFAFSHTLACTHR